MKQFFAKNLALSIFFISHILYKQFNKNFVMLIFHFILQIVFHNFVGIFKILLQEMFMISLLAPIKFESCVMLRRKSEFTILILNR